MSPKCNYFVTFCLRAAKKQRPKTLLFRLVSVNADHTVLFDGDRHAFFYIVQELIAQTVYYRHADVGAPDGCQDGTGGRQRVNGLAEQHAGGLTAHGAGTVNDQAPGGGADSLGQTQSLPRQFLAMQVRVILISAGGLLITELQSALEGGPTY